MRFDATEKFEVLIVSKSSKHATVKCEKSKRELKQKEVGLGPIHENGSVSFNSLED